MRATNQRKRWYLKAINHRRCILCKKPIKSAYEKGSVRVVNIGVCTAHKLCVQKALKEQIEIVGDD